MTRFLIMAILAVSLAGCAADPFVPREAGRADECTQADGVECK